MKHLKKIFEDIEFDDDELRQLYKLVSDAGWSLDYIGEASVFTKTRELKLDDSILISNEEYPADDAEIAKFSWMHQGYSMCLLLPDGPMIDPFFMRGDITLTPNIDIRQYCKVDNYDFFASSKEQLELLDEFIESEIKEVEEIINDMRQVQQMVKTSLPLFNTIKQKFEKKYFVLRFDDPDPMSHHFPFCLVSKFELPKKLR